MSALKRGTPVLLLIDLQDLRDPTVSTRAVMLKGEGQGRGRILDGALQAFVKHKSPKFYKWSLEEDTLYTCLNSSRSVLREKREDNEDPANLVVLFHQQKLVTFLWLAIHDITCHTRLALCLLRPRSYAYRTSH